MKPATNEQIEQREATRAKGDAVCRKYSDTFVDELIARIRQEELSAKQWEAEATLWMTNEKDRRAEIERLRALLKVARCPNTDCMLGVVPGNPTPDGDWDVCQCQWCDEKDAALDTEAGS